MDTAIGQTIKVCRKQRNMTLKQVSDQTGLSVSYLSLVERGLTSATISSLQKICSVFDLTMQELLNHLASDACLTHPSERETLWREEPGVTCRSLIRTRFPRGGLVLEVEDEGLHQAGLHMLDEIIYVVRGSMNVWLNEIGYTMHPGDSLTVPAKASLRFCRKGTEPCLSLWVY